MKKIERILSSLLVVIMMVGIAPISNYAIKASAKGNYNGLIYNIEYYNNSIAIIGCDKDKSGEVVIPSSIDGYEVTTIQGLAFEDCTKITSITIPESVTSIGESVFWGCTDLSKIQVSKNNKVYDSRNDCNAIIETSENKLIAGCKDTVIPDGVETIMYNAFAGCTGLTSITIPDSVTLIDMGAFNGCSELNQITVSKNNKVYDSRNNCNAIIEKETNSLVLGCKSTKIPDSVTAIDYPAFSGCKDLTNIIIPNSVTSIGNGVFLGCTSLANIVIPSSVTSIGLEAFKDCTSLTNITIPDSVTDISYSAFANCTSLESVTIGKNVTSVENEMFWGCSSLSEINVSEGNEAYDSRNSCNAIIATATDSLILGCKNTKIPDSVISIGAFAFSYCTGLTSITIPAGVTSIDNYAFSECSELSRITVSPNNPIYDSRNNCNGIIDTAASSLIIGCKSTVIPNNVTAISDYAFNSCTGLTNIAIPDSVTDIGESAFSGCTGLTNIVIPDSVTDIGEHAFSGCTGLTNITVSDSVTNIRFSTFYGCTGLTSVTIPDSVEYIESRAFEGCVELARVDFSRNLETLGTGAFNDCVSLSEMNVPEGNKKYDSRNSCNAIIETATNCLVLGCKNTKIPGSVTSIGNYAFVGCKGLENITIPSSITSIGISAFLDCVKLSSIIIPDSVTKLGNTAFLNCSSLKKAVIGSGISKIESSMFANCYNLESVVITDSITDIDSWAFESCDALKDIYYAGSKEDWENKVSVNDYGNQSLDKVTFHYNWTEHEHTLKHITVPSTCKEAGKEYDVCSKCGETFNEKALPLAAHTWSKWTVVKEATTTAEGQEKRSCSVCGKVETRTIEKLKALIDEKTGVEVIYNDEYDSGTELRVEEKFDGKSFQLVNSAYGEVKTSIFDIATYKNGIKVQPSGEITVRIPLPTSYSSKVFVCYVDSANGKVTKIPCEVKGGYVIFKTNHFSEYAIIEQPAGVNSVSVSDVTLNYKKSATIKPTVKADDGAEYAVEYSSSNTKVATVDENGKVYGAKKGSATITCTVTDSNGNTVTDTCKVTVKYSFGQWLIVILLFGWIWY